MPGPPYVPIRGFASPNSIDALDWHRKPSRSNEDQIDSRRIQARRKDAAADVDGATGQPARRQRTRSIERGSDRKVETRGMARRGDALGSHDRRHTVAESSRTASTTRSERRTPDYEARLQAPSPRRITPSSSVHADLAGRSSPYRRMSPSLGGDDNGSGSARSVTPPHSTLPRGILVPADRVVSSAASIALHAANGGKGKGRMDDGAWVAKIGRFELAGEIQLPGFSLMAVDKWCVLGQTALHVHVSP